MGTEGQMILTFKVKHGRDFTAELTKARKVAEFGIEHRSLSSADVKHIGLKSMISNQILKKFARDKKAKRVRSVPLIVPNQGIKVDKERSLILIPCLKLELPYQFRNDFEKINQIELNNEYAFISITISEPKATTPTKWLGVDLNTTGHCVVVGNPETGKVIKMGKKAEHTHKKYKNMRKSLQKQGKYRKVKKIKNREQRIVKDLNHKMSKKIVSMAKENGYGIRLEDLKGIRDNSKHSKSFRYSLNSWSFYQLQIFVEYKAKLQGVSVEYIAPEYTSQTCSICGLIGNRNGKDFKCSNCGHVDNADCNASFNIALRQPEMAGICQSNADRDVLEGSTDTPKEAML
jgi:putative transposase